jgi:hypothetical protein
LASNGGKYQLWQYSGCGASWTALTGTNTVVREFFGGDWLSALLSNDGGDTFDAMQYGGAPYQWFPLPYGGGH